MNQLEYSSYRPLDEVTNSTGPGRGLVALAGLTAAGLALVITRGLLTGNWWFFLMLTWNLFLAFFPLGVVLVLRDLRAAGFLSRWLLATGLAAWLTFLPNAPYIITDLYHIQHIPTPLLWFDTMTLFLFALTGSLAGLYSILIVHRMLKPLFGVRPTWILILLSQALCGFGIYLGRFGRWNSWHVLTKPSMLSQAILQSYHDHLSIKLTLAYGFVLAVLYIAFYVYNEYENHTNPNLSV